MSKKQVETRKVRQKDAAGIRSMINAKGPIMFQLLQLCDRRFRAKLKSISQEPALSAVISFSDKS